MLFDLLYPVNQSCQLLWPVHMPQLGIKGVTICDMSDHIVRSPKFCTSVLASCKGSQTVHKLDHSYTAACVAIVADPATYVHVDSYNMCFMLYLTFRSGLPQKECSVSLVSLYRTYFEYHMAEVFAEDTICSYLHSEHLTALTVRCFLCVLDLELHSDRIQSSKHALMNECA